MRVLDLFSGIGSLSLGLGRVGMTTVAFCEQVQFRRDILAKHWPGVPCYHDVRNLTAEQLRSDGIGVDVICGGFPCQDISLAGKGAGITGKRSGLWIEFARLIGEIRPSYVIVENVAALLGRGMSTVLGDLAALRYDAEWHCIPAKDVGADHERDRVWIVANSSCERFREAGKFRYDEPTQWAACGSKAGGVASNVDESGLEVVLARFSTELASSIRACSWPAEPDVARMVYGVADRVDRISALGDSCVPQIPEIIGRAIMGAVA